jgi:hypothetical protein
MTIQGYTEVNGHLQGKGLIQKGVMKKTVFTLNIGDYEPRVRAITYPLLKYYAHKIGANFVEITNRKFPDWPVTYEKLQIFQLGRENDWNIYIDADALVHPDSPDWTVYLNRDTVAHWGADEATVRWRYDKYFLRHGQHWGTGNWFTIGSDWCLDMWRPLEVTPEKAIDCIYPIHQELNTKITPAHLVDDYALSNNIARFGLKTIKLTDLRDTRPQLIGKAFCMHWYMMDNDTKVSKLQSAVEAWRIPKEIKNFGK